MIALVLAVALPLCAAPFQGRGFSLDAPDAPWSREREPGADRDFFIAPRKKGASARGALKIERFGPLSPYASAAAYAEKERGKRPLAARRLPAGQALVWDGERRAAGAKLRTRTAAVPALEGFVVVSWQAPAASFQDGLAAFDRALETLRFAAP